MKVKVEMGVSPAIMGVDGRDFELELAPGATVRDALLALSEASPGFKARMGDELYKVPPRLPVLVSINKRTTGYHDTPVQEGDVLFLFPTVFGG